jgi:trehalose 6-phosphate phosphatase
MCFVGQDGCCSTPRRCGGGARFSDARFRRAAFRASPKQPPRLRQNQLSTSRVKASAERKARTGDAVSRVPAPRSSWAYFFDIDGTLVDIAPSPSEIIVERELRALVCELFDATGGALALISGRSMHDVDTVFRDRLPVAGQHGLERRNSEGKITRHVAELEKLDFARERVGEAIAAHPELLLEDKGLSLALHYRSAPALASFAHRTMRNIVSMLGPEFVLQSGKRVVELKPSGKDKGDAVRDFMREKPFEERKPVFVGDDVTDEQGFAVVNALGGHSIKVGGGSTAARWRLANVNAVRSWLRRRDSE